MEQLKHNGIYDIHCHVLPGIDDGCSSSEMSISVLRRSMEQGVCAIAATPHYYPKETVDSFLERRQTSYQKLLETLGDGTASLPMICLGAEVAYHPGLINEEQLNQLCIGNSHYMLLELPFSRWSSNVLRDVRTMKSVRGVTPIIAHFERYFKIQEKQTLELLTNANVRIQMNAGYLLDFRRRHKAKKLLKSGIVQILASDCHNITNRPPNLGQAFQYLHKSGMEYIADELSYMSGKIFEENR